MRERQLLIAERDYLRRLVRLIRQMRVFLNDTPVEQLPSLLQQYATVIEPWAQTIASLMVRETARREAQSTRAERLEREIARGTRFHRALIRELSDEEQGAIFRRLQAEQVTLITSLPREAADRLQGFITEASFGGITAVELRQRVQEQAGVSLNRAKLIARTETARVFSNLTQARSQAAGSTHYTWRAGRDSHVRPTHRRLDGRVFAWNDPPVCEADGVTRGNPGTTWNCRCVALPIFPD